jgi:colanic acid biosynthesis glycosyl transferase WcaI
MATGQYLSEVAEALVQRGHDVTVVTSCRAYDSPQTVFLKREVWRGIKIHRIAATGFGKRARWRRALDFASFLVVCWLKLLFAPKPDVLVALTSPPLVSVLGAVASRMRGCRFVYWVMDFNPDEAIAAGWLRKGSLAARTLESLSRFSLRSASCILVLDRFMRDRITAKAIEPSRIKVLPLWSHDADVRFDAAGRERFRQEHGLSDKFVVMYSGNHSPCHPLDTLVNAARSSKSQEVMFCFVGGGSEFRRLQDLMKQAPLPNLLLLPYQPLTELSASLSAADLHVVVMGEPFVGLVHPCKVYNLLRVGSPVLYIGPASSHVTDIAAELNGTWRFEQARHGDVPATLAAIERVRGDKLLASKSKPTGANAFSSSNRLPALVSELEAVGKG